MMKHAFLITLLGAALVLSACSPEKAEVLKSPCVGIEGSPCGPKHVPSSNPQLQQPVAPDNV